MSAITIINRLLFGIIGLALIASSIKLFSLERLVSNEHADNATSCPYYFTMQSVLASYPLLDKDGANTRFIKNKLMKFEREINRNSNPLSQAYKKQYYQTLASLHSTSIKVIGDKYLILAIAKKTSSTIDNYYLDKRINCINPLYDWHGQPSSRRVLRFNLNGLYDQLPNKYLQILSAISDDWLTGSSAGFLIINQTTALDSRFMTGMPLLTALYILPKYDFFHVGTYGSAANWNYFRVNSFLDPVTRKVLNVGGVDVFTVAPDDLGKKIIPGVQILHTTMNPLFGPYLSFINRESYGLAYLAEHITIADPETIKPYEHIVKQYFSRHEDHAAFFKATNFLYDKIMLLKSKHDIILETKSHTPTPSHLSSAQPDAVKILGMVGGRNYFSTHCGEPFCTFVLNYADAPGWYAFVNGVNTKIERVNFAFMGITVPYGQSTVWFIYSPLSWTLTYFVSILSLIGLIFAGCRKKSLT